MATFRGAGGDKNLKKNIYVALSIEEYKYRYSHIFFLIHM